MASKKDRNIKVDNNIKLFEKTVKKYIEFFNLHDWNIEISSQQDEDTLGSAYFNDDKVTMNSSRNATISYSYPFIENAKKAEIIKTAFHEILEVYFSDIRIWLENNAVLPDYIIDSKIHSFIHLFENKVLNLIEGDKTL